MKVCSHCNVEKGLDEFYFVKSRNRYSAICKECDKAASRARHRKYRDEDSERLTERNRITKLKSRYGLTPEEYEEMFKSQSGKCKICHEELTDSVIDHCHETGKVRGILCRHCNSGLGLFKDNTTHLMNAIKYLEGTKC